MTVVPELQNIFKDTDGKWWIESADDLDEGSHDLPNDYHGSFLTLSEAERYMNTHFDFPASYFIDRSGVRYQPFHLTVHAEELQDRAGSREVRNHAVRPMHAAPPLTKLATLIETHEPKIYYVQDGDALYSLKPNEFRAVQEDRGCIVSFKTIKHMPTCVTRRGDIIVSTDSRRPMYYYVDDILKRR